MKRMFGLVLAAAVVVATGAMAAENSAAAPKGAIHVLQRFVDEHLIAGAVTLVADKDRILSLEAIGFADIEQKKPMQGDCVFWIASQSKPITSTAMMTLVDEGKVNVDDPVEKYLPEFKGQMVVAEKDDNHVLLKKPVHPIRVRDILSHTSGLPFKSAIEQPTLDLYPLETRVHSYAAMPLDFEPGAKSQYSNAGLNTAGRIIEVVSGMPYAKYLDEKIFKPLGMKDTTFWPTAEQLQRLAKSYKPNGPKKTLDEVPINQLLYPLNDPARQPMPAGGLFSTATDLSIFYRMLLNGGVYEGKRIVSEKSIAMMTSKQTGDLPQPYGFGFATGKFVGHGGAYGTHSSIAVDQQIIVIFLIQQAGWIKDGKKAQPTYQKAAIDTFAPLAATRPADAMIIKCAPAAPKPVTMKPPVTRPSATPAAAGTSP